jgi:hypothetical protein
MSAELVPETPAEGPEETPAVGPPEAPPIVVDEAAPVAPVVERPRRRVKVIAGVLRILRFAIAVALFVGGVALGVMTFQRMAPPAPVVGDVSTGGVETPAVVQELVLALESNDADALRSAVQADPYRQIAAEMQTWDLKEVKSVETLATMQDGARSATEIVILGRRTADQAPLVFNLIVHVSDGTITEFR